MTEPVNSVTGPVHRIVLTVEGPDRPGIVHAVTGVLVEHAANIRESVQFGDPLDGHYYLRIGADVPAGVSAEHLQEAFGAVECDFGLTVRLRSADRRTRVLILVSRFGHCLNDLLYRWHNGDLPIEVVAVVGNHTDHQEMVEWYGVPFVHVPVTPETKPQSEQRIRELTAQTGAELIVLARYMQILSEDLTAELEGRCINIHHSFLPSFKGARPYHQAWERGVKMVGATAHYVTSDLDEGPIIAQRVIDVDHSYSPQDLARIGRGAEAGALSQAVRDHCEDRVFVQGLRTIVLR